ncbi:hypothetical protein FQN60_005962 [Etheostoma spectabile]|uniref:Pleckstrin homology domain-containing protein n=1 Tax=Etheostoma spectabile TaxID=54343 RepID=A0A5J5CF71_9PERO|nr:hypothetical protein FQN60_005962 [Etheostoma spectabile]
MLSCFQELERSWREYDRLGADVTLAKSNLLEQLEALGSPQTEPPSQRHIQIQKELWRIQDVMEALAKNKPQRSTEGTGLPGSKPLSSLQKNEAVTLLPIRPLREGDSVPPRPPLPQYYDSSERPPHVPPHQSHPGGRLPPHTHRTEDRKAGSRNGVHSTLSDPSRPILTHPDPFWSMHLWNSIVVSVMLYTYMPPHPVGIIPPRTKSPMSPCRSPPESSTIASYVTLRKTKKPESRSDRPRSAVDQTGSGERESRLQAEGACADPVELEAALQQLKAAHMERSRTAAKAQPAPQEVQRVEEVKDEVQRDGDGHGALQSVKEANSTDSELCESQRVVIVDLGVEPQRVEIVNLHSFEDDESREQDLTSSPTNTTTDNSFQTPEPETPSPEPREDEPDTTQQRAREEKLELTADDKKHNNNNNNMLACNADVHLGEQRHVSVAGLDIHTGVP